MVKSTSLIGLHNHIVKSMLNNYIVVNPTFDIMKLIAFQSSHYCINTMG
jgi:hypothetical protein